MGEEKYTSFFDKVWFADMFIGRVYGDYKGIVHFSYEGYLKDVSHPSLPNMTHKVPSCKAQVSFSVELMGYTSGADSLFGIPFGEYRLSVLLGNGYERKEGQAPIRAHAWLMLTLNETDYLVPFLYYLYRVEKRGGIIVSQEDDENGMLLLEFFNDILKASDHIKMVTPKYEGEYKTFMNYWENRGKEDTDGNDDA